MSKVFRRIQWFFFTEKKRQSQLRIAITAAERAVVARGAVTLLLTLGSANGSAQSTRTVTIHSSHQANCPKSRSRQNTTQSGRLRSGCVLKNQCSLPPYRDSSRGLRLRAQTSSPPTLSVSTSWPLVPTATLSGKVSRLTSLPIDFTVEWDKISIACINRNHLLELFSGGFDSESRQLGSTDQRRPHFLSHSPLPLCIMYPSLPCLYNLLRSAQNCTLRLSFSFTTRHTLKYINRA